MARIILALAAWLVCWGAAQAEGGRHGLDLVNRSHGTVRSFFVSAAGTEHWKEDLLGRRGLLPNHFVQLDLDDTAGACRFDLKVVFNDGTSVVYRNVDICKLRTYAVTD